MFKYLELVIFLLISIVIGPNQDTLELDANVRLNLMLTVVNYPPVELERVRVRAGNDRGI